MKKIFFLAIALISFSAIFAAPAAAVRVEKLTSKVILQNTQGYFVLSDASCWKVIGFEKRWRSLSEWWNNVELAPESYNCVPNDWQLGTEIEIYSKYSNLQVPENNASNQDELRQCTHMFFNSRTRQVLFAVALEPEDCIIKLYADAREEGYNLGYSQGKLDASLNYQNGYSDGKYTGYNDGYKDGYDDGYKAGSGVIIIQN